MAVRTWIQYPLYGRCLCILIISHTVGQTFRLEWTKKGPFLIWKWLTVKLFNLIEWLIFYPPEEFFELVSFFYFIGHCWAYLLAWALLEPGPVRNQGYLSIEQQLNKQREKWGILDRPFYMKSMSTYGKHPFSYSHKSEKFKFMTPLEICPPCVLDYLG